MKNEKLLEVFIFVYFMASVFWITWSLDEISCLRKEIATLKAQAQEAPSKMRVEDLK